MGHIRWIRSLLLYDENFTFTEPVMSTGLSDALTRMAGGQHYEPDPTSRGRSSDTRAVDDSVILGELDEPRHQTAHPPTGADPKTETPARSRARTPAGRDANHGLKAAAVPVLITVGLLLLIPGVWSLLILTGTWESPREDAKTMAVAMLATWPIALSMFAGAGFFWWQIRQK